MDVPKNKSAKSQSRLTVTHWLTGRMLTWLHTYLVSHCQIKSIKQVWKHKTFSKPSDNKQMAYSQVPLRCRRLDGKWCNSFSSQYCMYGIKYRTPTHWLSRWSQSDGPIPTWQRGCGFMQPPREDQVWIFRIVWMIYGKFMGNGDGRSSGSSKTHCWSSHVSECWLEEHHSWCLQMWQQL